MCYCYEPVLVDQQYLFGILLHSNVLEDISTSFLTHVEKARPTTTVMIITQLQSTFSSLLKI